MYQNILVPLDESELAELAIPHAKELAKRYNSRITLMEVAEARFICTEPGVGGPVVVELMDYNQLLAEAKQYLEKMADLLRKEGLTVDTVVKTGDPASWICDYADAEKIDLIVMSTHGRSGISRWVYGSVADRVLRGAKTPVLLIRANLAE